VLFITISSCASVDEKYKEGGGGIHVSCNLFSQSTIWSNGMSNGFLQGRRTEMVLNQEFEGTLLFPLNHLKVQTVEALEWKWGELEHGSEMPPPFSELHLQLACPLISCQVQTSKCSLPFAVPSS
jgi:hypothetical protein